MRPVQKTEHK